jgi:hypothetical protein
MPSDSMNDRLDRRRSVRMRPLPELAATAELIGSDGGRAALHVVDVSVGGLGLARDSALRFAEVGRKLALTLSLAQHGTHDVQVEVRWASDSIVGVQFVGLSPTATTGVRRYVAELLERGAPS